MRALRATVAFLVLPVVVAGLVPFLIVRERALVAPMLIPGGLFFGAGLLSLLWCVRDFFVSGRGTLAPWDPPKRLVVVGLYRFVRNPMYLSVLTIIAGWSALFLSPALATYLLMLAVAFHIRVTMGEEPSLKRHFGAEWENYARATGRWLPRWMTWRK